MGSTIKPLLYYAALENGLVSSSTFLSEPTTFVIAFSIASCVSVLNEV